MKIIACVPVVNRPDLLQAALLSLLPFTKHRRLDDGPPPAISAPPYPKSIPPAIDHIWVLDNSGAGLAFELITSSTNSQRGKLMAAEFEGRLRVQHPEAPLTFAQTQNVFQNICRAMDADAILFAHSDMVATPEAVARVIAATRRDAIVFSHYDVLATFGADVIRRVGPWDPAIPWYYADNDWYRRARLAGVEVVEVGGEGVTHQNDASSTMKSDWRIALATHQQTSLARAVYVEKWGGPPEHERFAVPYDGWRLIPPVETLMGTPLYGALSRAFATHHGTLFEQEPRARAAQLRALAWAYEQAGRPQQIVETGTAKGFFGYLLGWLAQQPTHLVTVDVDEATVAPVELLSRAFPQLSIGHITGDSRAVLPNLRLQGAGLAWVDGGHDEATAFSDVAACLRANVPWVLVDDTEMPEVRRAVNRALVAYPAYRETAHPWRRDDTRQIAVLRLREA